MVAGREFALGGLMALGLLTVISCNSASSAGSSSVPAANSASSSAPTGGSAVEAESSITEAGQPQSSPSDAPQSTFPPTPLFGVPDETTTFGANSDLEAEVRELRAAFPQAARVPVAIPTGASPDATVTFIGMVSWDGITSVTTVVKAGGETLLTVGALPPSWAVCVDDPVTSWAASVIRDDESACVSPTVDRPVIGQWAESGYEWQYFGSDEDLAESVRLVSGLRLV